MLASFMKIGSILTALALPFTQNTVLTRPNQMETTAEKNFHQFKMKTIDGKVIDFSQFKGKKIVILNTASKCGYTPQYQDLQKLYDTYKEKLVIIGFPCNQFGYQESGSVEEIQTFCKKNYGVTFVLTEKIDVKGNNQHPIYKWLCNKTENDKSDASVKWNFNKFLVDENGTWIAYFPSSVKPLSEEITSKLK
jgi:glutathione peroxidase